MTYCYDPPSKTFSICINAILLYIYIYIYNYEKSSEIIEKTFGLSLSDMKFLDRSLKEINAEIVTFVLTLITLMM